MVTFMIIFLIISFLIFIYKLKFVSVNDEYISKYQTTCINGFFVLMILICHFTDYIDLNSIDKSIFKIIRNQLIVVPFLFFSGYGIMESIKTKGNLYVKKIIKNRFFKVLIHALLALLIFLVVQFLLGNKLAISFVGWEFLINSNWYIFAILCAYLFTYISFLIFKNNHFKALLSIVFFSLVYVFIFKILRNSYWYNTFLCFVIGMFYSLYKNDLEKVLKEKGVYIVVLFIFINLFLVYFALKKYFLIDLLLMIVFSLLIVLLSMKIKVGNKVLFWLGEHVFGFYVLQRIPMIFFGGISFISKNMFIYFGLVFVVTGILSVGFDKLIKRLDRLLFF